MTEERTTCKKVTDLLDECEGMDREGTGFRLAIDLDDFLEICRVYLSFRGEINRLGDKLEKML